MSAATGIYTGLAAAVLAHAREELGALDRIGGPSGRISVGGGPSPLPYEAVVREVPQSGVSISDPVSSVPAMGRRACAPLELDVPVAVELWSTRASVEDAAADVWAWFQALAASVATDRTLGGLCAHATPYYESGGTAVRDNQYIAAIDCGVRCRLGLLPLTKEENDGN